ncbi:MULTISPECIES: hypothetical protein [unclassified Streptomyces]|uniref:hypothetical protein n=1 Tax=unclassified Streptomyces TaxID=2593676 RepID=UPI000A67259D|nr:MULTISPECIES: hypothetical protein [unclassified Streptomyces]
MAHHRRAAAARLPRDPDSLEQNTDGLRAKDICHTLGTRTEPRHTEGMRAKLKRLVSRGILTESEPGLFTLTQPPPATPETSSS